MKVHPSALRHGVGAEDAVRAAERALQIEPLTEEENPERELRLRIDTRARLLETVVLVFDSGDQVIIHAMPARARSTWTCCRESQGQAARSPARFAAETQVRSVGRLAWRRSRSPARAGLCVVRVMIGFDVGAFLPAPADLAV
ncbi:hypothetical protein GCM10023168_21010 [Fodinibacter luteus]|uniref:Uncharacterized protein n=1 Tax=Fodinibacter luteus TaxID=552064 RepID=A0ABP8KGQ0_9MICO